MTAYLSLTRTRQIDANGLELLRLECLTIARKPSLNPRPITLKDLARAYRSLPHQDEAFAELEADARATSWDAAMRRTRPWYATWAPGPAAPQSLGSQLVVSGARGAQVFRIGTASRAGSLEPLPEGQWGIEPPAWASGRAGDWGASWGPGLGPVSVPLVWQGPGRTERSAIEIHIDWNGRTSPGTAGCVGIKDRQAMQSLLTWLEQAKPARLFVDWRLGTCPKPY